MNPHRSAFQIAACTVLFLGSLTASCATVERTVLGPVEALVTIPGARAGQSEQFLVEASTNRSCQAGVRAFRNQDWELSITAFDRALMEDPEDHNAHFALGVAYEQMGNYSDALEHYETAARLSPKPDAAYAMSIERIRTKLGR